MKVSTTNNKKGAFVRSNPKLMGICLSVLAFCSPALAQSEYNPAHCSLIAGTMDIHWEAVEGPNAPCTGIEFTDGTVADAADGHIAMSGTGVSDEQCLGTDSYEFTVSEDGLSLTGGTAEVPMTMTRSPGEACFVGHWVSEPHDFLAHIWAAPFLGPPAAIGVPVNSPAALAAMLLALGAAALFAIRRRGRFVRREIP